MGSVLTDVLEVSQSNLALDYRKYPPKHPVIGKPHPSPDIQQHK